MNLMNSFEIAAAFAKKPLSQPEKNLIAKLESFGVEIPPANMKDGIGHYRSNPFGGGTELAPAAAALYDFCMEGYKNYSYGFGFSFNGHKFPIAIYDRSRYLMLKIWPDVYSVLLD
jgi:hypothetical protein